MFLSLVVCTRDRAEKLQQTLASILALDVGRNADYELLVIDNGSKDRTREVCAAFGTFFSGRLRIVGESRPGLARARNAGLANAKGEVIAFIDDDIVPDSQWLEVLMKEFRADSQLQGICGRVELFNPADLPTTTRTGTERMQISSIDNMFCNFTGCNMAIRTKLFQRAGFFDEDFGAGGRYRSGEDIDFWYRCLALGAKLVYIPDLLVYHDHGRRLPVDKKILSRGYIFGRGAFYAKHLLRDPQILRHMYWETRAHAIHPWKHLVWLYGGFLSCVTGEILRKVHIRKGQSR